MPGRGLVKPMLVIGGAQGLNVLISILRVKVLAVLLGPAGVGMLSIFNNLQETASIGAGLGLTTSGVREIASAKGETEVLSRIRRVFLISLMAQGLLAMAVVWLLRKQLAVWLTGETVHSTEIGLVGIAVFLFLLAGSQTALLQGMRRIGDLARVTVYGALAGTVVGISAVWFLGQDGLIWFILAPPLATLLAATRYARRLPSPISTPMTLEKFWYTWWPMVRLGLAFMLGGLMTAATLLLVRGFITRELGLGAAGQFAAAWSITMTYIGYLLHAMGADYFPRLTEIIHDRESANALINDQAQLALAIGGPVLLLMIGGAPWLIRLIYSSEFDPAVPILQWQTVGNVFKLASWSLGFAVIAAGKSGLFLCLEAGFNIVFLAIMWLGFPLIGFEIAGIAFLATYALHLGALHILLRRLQGFQWQRLTLWLIGGHGALAFCLLALALTVPTTAAVIGAVLALSTGLIGGHIVTGKVGTHNQTAARLSRFYAAIGWPISKTP